MNDCLPELLTTREAAAILHIRPETLLAWDRSGKLRGYRISSNALRWDPAEIADFLRGTREGPSMEEEVAAIHFQSPGPGPSIPIAAIHNRGGDHAR
jgi:hypothetical protein